MHDVELVMEDRPGQLALMGEVLGAAGISVEGGGMFLAGGRGVAHFLVADGESARRALEDAGMTVVACRDVVVQRLRQDQPGQLGELCRAMAEADVNIEVLYSDHDHQLVLVVDDPTRAHEVSRAWMRRR